MNAHVWNPTDPAIDAKYDATCALCGMRRLRESGEWESRYKLPGGDWMNRSHVPACVPPAPPEWLV